MTNLSVAGGRTAYRNRSGCCNDRILPGQMNEQANIAAVCSGKVVARTIVGRTTNKERRQVMVKAKARALEMETPACAVTRAMDATADAVVNATKSGSHAIVTAARATVKGTSKGIYSGFYYLSFGLTYTMLSALMLVGHNPISDGIKDGATDAAQKTLKSKKR